jgi:hypothetical protein
MFPLSIGTYVKIGAIILLLCGTWYNGYSIGSRKLDNYKLSQQEVTATKNIEIKTATDQIRKAKDEQIASINTQLANALVELRNRPSRSTTVPINGTCGTGATLFAEDAEFLTREAARADIIRSALDACYNQYDKVTDAK